MIDTGSTNKYLHNHYEMAMMAFLTAISNAVMIPQIIYSFKIKNSHILFLTVLLFLSSFMYHLCESIGTEPLILKEVEWHQIDNIASICGLMELFNYLMQTDKSTRKLLQWSSFIIVVIIQESHAWNVWATVGPILVSGGIFAIQQVCFPKKHQKLNQDYLKKGLCYLAVAFVAFYCGLDEYKDYLRIWHGLWHISITIAFFHLYQIYNPRVFSYIECWDLTKQFDKE